MDNSYRKPIVLLHKRETVPYGAPKVNRLTEKPWEGNRQQTTSAMDDGVTKMNGDRAREAYTNNRGPGVGGTQASLREEGSLAHVRHICFSGQRPKEEYPGRVASLPYELDQQRDMWNMPRAGEQESTVLKYDRK